MGKTVMSFVMSMAFAQKVASAAEQDVRIFFRLWMGNALQGLNLLAIAHQGLKTT